MCIQHYITYKTCTHTYPSHKTRCLEAGLPTQYRQHCKSTTRKDSVAISTAAAGGGYAARAETEWQRVRFRIPEDRREERDGLCPDCAMALSGEMGRVFEEMKKEVEEEKEKENGKKGREDGNVIDREDGKTKMDEEEKKGYKFNGWMGFFSQIALSKFPT